MKRSLFTITAGDHERQLLANDPGQALSWLVGNDSAIADADSILVQRNTGLVDLTGKPAKGPHPAAAGERSTSRRPIPPPMPPKRSKAVKRAKVKPEAKSSAKEITTADTSVRLGINSKNVANLANRGWLTRGSYGHITVASIERCEKNFESGKWNKPVEGKRPAAKEEKRAAPAKPEKPKAKERPTTAEQAEPAPAQDKFILIEKLAPQLKMTVDQLEEVKKNGNIAGGYGWINATALEAYMKSPSYEPPFSLQ